MMENRCRECPICNKVSEKNKDEIVPTKICDHEMNFLMDKDNDVFGDSEEEGDEIEENGMEGSKEGTDKKKRRRLVGKYPMS